MQAGSNHVPEYDPFIVRCILDEQKAIPESEHRQRLQDVAQSAYNTGCNDGFNRACTYLGYACILFAVVMLLMSKYQIVRVAESA